MDEHINAHYDTIIIIMIWKTQFTIGFSSKRANQKGTFPALYVIIHIMASPTFLYLDIIVLATCVCPRDDHHNHTNNYVGTLSNRE